MRVWKEAAAPQKNEPSSLRGVMCYSMLVSSLMFVFCFCFTSWRSCASDFGKDFRCIAVHCFSQAAGEVPFFPGTKTTIVQSIILRDCQLLLKFFTFDQLISTFIKRCKEIMVMFEFVGATVVAIIALYFGGESLVPGAVCLYAAPVDSSGKVMAALKYDEHGR